MSRNADLLAIYHETVRPLYAYVSRRTGGDREVSEDVTQEAWLRAVADWPRQGPPDEPLAWLKTVASRLLANHFRRRPPRPVDPAELEIESDEWQPRTPAAIAFIHRGMARLRRNEVRLLEAFYFERKATRTLAAELGVSERAVEARLRRARASLAKRLRPYLHEREDER
jgi:RNA polymerase sigma-70 factor (ECF subfamily)